MLTKKDLIALNQQFSNGQVLNEGSLDFVLKQTYRSRHWYKTMCLLTRAILVDHIFEDGNKRTAAAVIMAYLDMERYQYNPDDIARLVLQLAKKRTSSIATIGRVIHHVIK